jgi:hypothetical protein
MPLVTSTGNYAWSAGTAHGGALTNISQFTLGAWVRPDAACTGSGIISAFFNGTTLPFVLGVSEAPGWTLASGDFAYGVYSGGWGYVSTGVAIASYYGRWVHLCATADGTNAAIYLDGKLMATNAVSTFPATRDLFVGKRWDGTPGQGFNGAIQDAFVGQHIWSREQIQRLAQGYTPKEVREGSLLGYWPFRDSDYQGNSAVPIRGGHWPLAMAGTPGWTPAVVRPVPRLMQLAYSDIGPPLLGGMHIGPVVSG